MTTDETARPIGYRFWLVDGDGDRKIPRHTGRMWTSMRGVAPTAGHSLLAPYGLMPWAPGWQTATCDRCETAGALDHGCGVSFFPSMDQLVDYLLPSDTMPNGPLLSFLPDAARWSIAVGRVELDGRWVSDDSQADPRGAFRAPCARLLELWVAPGAGRSAHLLGLDYRVPAHQGEGTVGEWLLSLVPWGAHVPVREPAPTEIPAITDGADLRQVVAASEAMSKRGDRILAKTASMAAKDPGLREILEEEWARRRALGEKLPDLPPVA